MLNIKRRCDSCRCTINDAIRLLLPNDARCIRYTSRKARIDGVECDDGFLSLHSSTGEYGELRFDVYISTSEEYIFKSMRPC